MCDQPCPTLQEVDRLLIAPGSSNWQVLSEMAQIDADIAAAISRIVNLSVMSIPIQLNPFDRNIPIEALLATKDVG